LLLSASIAPAKSAIGLENRVWKIFPLAAHSHQVNRGQVAEAQRERAPPQRSTAPGCVLGPESGGTDVTARLTLHLDNAIDTFDTIGLTPAQQLALNDNPGLEAAFRGSQIDSIFKESVAADSDLTHPGADTSIQVRPGCI
jgi:hypothetical protein